MGRKKHLKKQIDNKENKSVEIENPFQTSLNYLQAQKMVEFTIYNQKYNLDMSEEVDIDIIYV